MIYWWRRSLAAQFIGFVLVTLIVSQALSFFISRNERERALYAASKSEFYTRATSLTRLMGSVPASLQQEALEASETAHSRFWISDSEPVDPDAWRKQAADELARPLANFVDFPQHAGFNVSSAIDDATRDVIASANAGQPWATPSEATWNLPQAARFMPLGGNDGVGFGLAVQLGDSTWLNTAYYTDSSAPWWNSQTLYSLAAAATFLSVIGIFAANRIARPLKRLAASAEAIGRGENVPSLPEEGTDDIRQTTAAFNRMQARLFRFIEDRTRMLAAIGHDLRTPLTSLRLRAEFVTDPDIQQRMLETINEIQTMTEATIAFARGEAAAEETRTVDLNALVGSLCDDLAEMHQPVVYCDGEKSTYRCRPDSLRRAIRNIIENAVRYGGEARVHLHDGDQSIDVVVEDNGTGIPEEMHEKVFAPFFRLEASRNRETGGVGLGLAIARTIVRRHGGDIVFSHGNPGFSVTVSLPKKP
ncbi:histidine kinase [Ensifer sp. Root142]|jgi:signal transduction histidine kinase|uniref:sensor histidine kinase n=1 Tax=Ensifer TaxID=106591 RepID=UPI00070D3D32|nr:MULTISPECIES: ATP-binding protein [Ensifer]KQW55647.1 histidine kinase [Ensifer sp. Root127]KQY76951.1 histidine kinase [Ensifer sp. Root142]NOV19990.1 HAMP domain-containing protein [Ensifer canadensis]